MKNPSWRRATKRRSGCRIGLVEPALVLSIAFFFLCLRPANAANLKATDAGLAIDAGSLGAFTLSYPVLLDSVKKPVHKLVETRATGKSATLKYEGGGQIDLAIASSGEVTLKFSNTSTDVKSYQMEMLIDLAFSKGGQWKIGGKEGLFPREKPAKPHLFQGNETQFKFSNAAGQSLAIRAPDYAYQQLQDNREWGWGTFAWNFIVPLDPANPESTLAISEKGSASAPAAPKLTPTQEGIDIDAGSLGSFTLKYPVLRDAAQKPVHKVIETKTAGGKAALKYDGGAQLEIAIATSGDMTLGFAQVSADVKSYVVEMLIDLALSKGGQWKIGDKEGSFPREKPKSPHLFQGNATTFRINNAQGQGLGLRMPGYAYQQLTDNREWGWGIFAWQCIVPFNPNQTQTTIAVQSDGSSAAAIKLVDRFGQSTLEEWPDKVKTMEEFKADVASERVYYESLHPPQRDRFGGLLDSAARLGLKKTGYFHVEQHGGKWWLADPDGNAFFHMAVCGFNPNDDYTYVKGRENIYEWLPPLESEFKSAFRSADGGAVFSFHLANTIRKFDRPYTHEDYSARMIERVRKWGFNSIGAFSAIAKAAHTANFPYVTHLPLNEWEGAIRRIPGVRETFDPFDEDTRQRVEKNLASKLPASASDPLLIGYFIVNEPAYEDIPTIVPSLNGKHACKRRLVQLLSEKYKTVTAYNLAWNAQAKSFEELNDAGLAVRTPAATGDVQAFTSLFLDTYFSLVRDAFRRHDPNHLLLGSRLQPVTIKNEPLCRIIGKYVDVMSYNYYTDGIDKALLKRVYEWTGGRPMMLSEFFWASPRDSGLVGGREVKSQQERGLAYRNYIEQSASLGFVIGLEWFTLVDQSVTGRWFSKYSGESSNSGLISVTDRPWKPMLTEMMKSNYEIYDVLLGERPPFAWDDARFK